MRFRLAGGEEEDRRAAGRPEVVSRYAERITVFGRFVYTRAAFLSPKRVRNVSTVLVLGRKMAFPRAFFSKNLNIDQRSEIDP